MEPLYTKLFGVYLLRAGLLHRCILTEVCVFDGCVCVCGGAFFFLLKLHD